jgi:membrane protein
MAAQPQPWRIRRYLRIRTRAPKWRLLARAATMFFENDLATSAAAISYYVMLMLFPLLIVLFRIGGTVIGGRELQQFVADYILTLLPGTQLFVKANLAELDKIGAGVVVSCVLLVFWASSWVFTSIEKALNRIWATQHRGFLHGRLLTLGMVVVSFVLMSMSGTLTSGVALLQAAAEQLPIQVPSTLQMLTGVVWQAVFAGASLLGSVLLFSLIYKTMPNTRVNWLETMPGALLAAVAWEGLKHVFAYMLPRFLEEYQVLYGGIWLALVLMTWIYISSLVMLFGAQLTAILHCDHMLVEPSIAPEEKLARAG